MRSKLLPKLFSKPSKFFQQKNKFLLKLFKPFKNLFVKLANKFKLTAKTKKRLKIVAKLIQFLYVVGLFVLSFVFFFYVTVFKLASVNALALWPSYYLAWKNYFLGNYLSFLLPIVTCLVFFTLLDKKTHPKRSWFKTLIISLLFFVLPLLLNFHAILIVSSFWRQNDLKKAVQIAIDSPQKVGLYAGKGQILDQLEKLDQAPKITQLPDNFDSKALLLKVKTNSQHGDFFQQTLALQLSNDKWPDYQLPTDNIILFENQLFFRKIEQADFEDLSSQLGFLLVKDYFNPRSIKQGAEIEIISRQEYLEFRNQQINDKAKEIDQEIASVNSQIATKRRSLTDIIMKYYYGELSYEQALSQYQSAQSSIGGLNQKKAELAEIKKIVLASKDQTPQELGIFLPEDNHRIKVVLDVTNKEAVNNYLAVLTHEYLHFASYIDDERYLPMFFEEGLTEYFSRQIVRQNTGIEVKIGYPIITKVIEQIAKRVDKDKLAEVYFTKDEKRLEAVLDEAFGNNFYQDSKMHFLMIPFAPVDKAVKYANDLINEVDGTPIDLESIKQEIEETEKNAKPV